MNNDSGVIREASAKYRLVADNGRLPEGYKLTEEGRIPGDWRTKKLGELASFRTGPFGSALHKSDYADDGIPVINPMHIIDGQILPTRTMTITESAAAKLADFRLAAGEVIIGRRGEMGRSAVVRESQIGWLCGTGSMIVRPLSGLDAEFLQRVLSSPAAISSIESSSVGSTMINLNQSILSNLTVQIPPIKEQRAIAAALSDADALLAKLDQLIAKKIDLKQAAMQQLLTGKIRLSGFSEEWEIELVSEFGDIITGGTPSTENKEFWGDEYPWITPTDITSKRDMFTSERQLTQKGLNSIRMLPPNTVLVTCIASIGKNSVLKRVGGCNQQINAIVPNERHNAEFLYYLFEFSKHYLLANAGITATSILSKVSFGEMKFKVPLIAEQTAIAAILSDMDAEIAVLEARRDKTRALKQGMMQELLTGRIRLV